MTPQEIIEILQDADGYRHIWKSDKMKMVATIQKMQKVIDAAREVYTDDDRVYYMPELGKALKELEVIANGRNVHSQGSVSGMDESAEAG